MVITDSKINNPILHLVGETADQLGLARLINRCVPIEFIGSHTLIFYIPQGGILLVTASLLPKLFLPDTPAHVWFYILIMWFVALSGLTLISYLKTAISSLISYLKTAI